MSLFKKITYLFIISMFFACSDENQNQENESPIDSVEIQSKFLFREALKELDANFENFKKINNIELSDYLIIGKEKDGFIFKDDIKKQLVIFKTKRIGLLTGYDVVVSDFSLLKAIDNNGFPMLIVKGYCNQTKEPLTIGIDVLKLKDGYSLRVQDPISSIVCNGCRRGCNPKRDSAGDGYCTDCKITNSNCSKTETL